ncbi:M48 family metalloprotease [Saccharopolyspora taberi]|uniref:Peptidase M48 domain-containing protein n=1 Tax=Saccharopolyspora taberi TaxID=60895 RepID=A0ABN3V392_9PSEU
MAGQPVDERVLSAGTTVRFVLLVVLLLVAGGSIALDLIGIGLPDSHDWGCALAAGWDPGDGTDQATSISLIDQASAYDACVERYAPAPPWWMPLGWPVLLSAVAAALFFGLAAWKSRRGRVVPVESVDGSGDLRRTLAELVEVAGPARAPRFVVDPSAMSTNAVVFGSNRRPTVCLHGGLVARRKGSPEAFRAVVLHELAHIRNRDVTITYATIALWRVFLALALLPFLVRNVYLFANGAGTPLWSSYAPGVTRNLLLTVVMVVLVFLVRSDVLRTREIYADRTAMALGADPRGWSVAGPAGTGGALRSALRSFVELWGTHPRGELRREALDDPATLFAVRTLLMFLTGAAAALINYHVWRYLKQYELAGWWGDQVAALVASALVAGVAGTVLWRAVVHAVLTSRPAPSGVRAGLWLGAGVAVGELVTGQEVIHDWIPAHPEFFLLVVLAGAVFAWWTSQSAELWISARRERTLRPAMALCLAAGCLVLSAWFSWWLGGGALLVAGRPFDLAGVSEGLARSYPGPAADHQVMLSAIAAAIPVVGSMTKVPLALAAVAALWVVPLLAWTAKQTGSTLRRVLLPGLLGGVACWVAVAGAQAHMHGLLPDFGAAGGLHELIYIAWLFVALVVMTAVTGAVTSALAGRFRLLVTLIAAETAALVGVAGAFVLASADGCVEPLNTLGTSCGWRPELVVGYFEILLTPVLVITAITAVIAAAVGTAFGRAKGKAPAEQAEPRTGRMVARRVCVGALCAVTAGIAVSQAVVHSDLPPTAAPPGVPGIVAAPEGTASSDEVRRFQVLAWRRYGGSELIDRFNTTTDDLLRKLDEADPFTAGADPVCVEIGRIGQDVAGYLRVPDEVAQKHWQRFPAQLGKVGRDCRDGLARRDIDRLAASLSWLEEAVRTVAAVDVWSGEVARGEPADPLPEPAPPAPQVPERWADYGGLSLLDRFESTWGDLRSYLEQVRGSADVTRIEPLCTEAERIAKEADEFFGISDPDAEERRRTFIAQARDGAAGCLEALHALDSEALAESLQRFEAATATAGLVRSAVGG